MRKFFEGIALMIGTIVGAGIFGLPYVMQQIGFWPGLILLCVFAVAVTFLHLMYGEIILRTNESHRFPGYGNRYLGKWAKEVFLVVDVVGGIGAILAYIILGGEFIAELFGGAQFFWVLAFWTTLSLLVIAGLKTIAKTELLLSIVLLAVMALIAFVLAPGIDAEHLSGFRANNLFQPIGVMIFALVGFSAINPVRDHFRNAPSLMPRVIIAGSIIPAIVYAFFALVIIGNAGPATAENALSGMREMFGSLPVVLGLIFGLVGVATSFLTLGKYLADIFYLDLRMARFIAYAVALGIPMALYVSGFRHFIATIGFAGGILGGIGGTLIIFVYLAAQHEGDRVPEYRLKLPFIVISFLILIFIASLIAGFM